VKVWAVLAWFDEDPRWLAASVAGFAKIADHVIAVDGAFFHYPQARAFSGGEQAETIVAAARASGIGCTVHVPDGVWVGNEVEKRNCCVRLVNALAAPYEDWWLVLDGDEEITSVSPLARQDLEQTDLDAADVGFWTTDELRSWFGPTRRLYRVLPFMGYGPSHYSVTGYAEGGEMVYLNGRGAEWGEPLVAALDLTTQIRVEHKHHLRPARRQESADVFNRARVDYDLEPWVRP
jgi:hypothetical protein